MKFIGAVVGFGLMVIGAGESMASEEDVIFESLPNDCLMPAFRFLDPADLGRVARVSTRWKEASGDPNLWREVGLVIHGDYLSEEDLTENPRQKVICHYLRVVVFATTDLMKIDRLVRQYKLSLRIPFFNKHQDLSFLVGFLINLVTNLSSREELITQGNEAVIRTKVNGLLDGQYGYERDLVALREFNETLIARGDQEAIKRKISALSQGGFVDSNTYDIPPHIYYGVPALVAVDERHTYRTYGYERNPAAVREFNETLVARGDNKALERKIHGLADGHYCCEKDPVIVREINETLIARGDQKAIERKIYGLANGSHGYGKDLAAARELNDALVERGDQKAIERKVVGRGYWGYQRNPIDVREANEILVGKGNITALKRKIEGLIERRDSYDPHHIAASGYEQNPIVAREFIESLSMSEFRITRGIGKYIKAFALKYGVLELGYKKETGEAIEFIRQNHIPY